MFCGDNTEGYEQGFAHIEAPHDKDGWCGRIFLSRGGPPERWYCQLDGKGLDGTQLMLPIKEVSAEADTELHADVVQALDEMRQEMRALVKRVGSPGRASGGKRRSFPGFGTRR